MTRYMGRTALAGLALLGAIVLGALTVFFALGAAYWMANSVAVDVLDYGGAGSHSPLIGFVWLALAVACGRGCRACWGAYWHADEP